MAQSGSGNPNNTSTAYASRGKRNPRAKSRVFGCRVNGFHSTKVIARVKSSDTPYRMSAISTGNTTTNFAATASSPTIAPSKKGGTMLYLCLSQL